MRGFISALQIVAGATARPYSSRPTVLVDLGYSVYQGTVDANNSINVFKGIRYAAPPLGDLRFAAPQIPTENSTIQPAASDPPSCPQTGPGAATPVEYNLTSAFGNEDCLFLNVYAPANATKLPVFFWIHGGGYGLGSANGLDPTEFMTTNDNAFISVIIQYRLGAFGFLSSDDIQADGALNAGLLDMRLALQWVQTHIGKFGGDPTRVTIAGESAGAGAVMYQTMAYGGADKTSLFQNIIAASPWVPHQYRYNDEAPTRAYADLTSAAGCNLTCSPLRCLRSANTSVLQEASFAVSEAGPWGTLAFLPVTDGTFIKDLPSSQLYSGSLNGKRMLTGNMANEGIPLSPYTKTLAAFRTYIDTTFPRFTTDDKAALETQYAYADDEGPLDPSRPLFATSGTTAITAVNQSAFGTGQQQRTFNVFAEYALDCPSYWLAAAFPNASWKYQFSAPPAYHGFDLQALWSGTKTPGKSFKHTFRKIWGNFIVLDDPRISVEDAEGGAVNSEVIEDVDGSGMIEWPVWKGNGTEVLLNLNTTGGVATWTNVTEELKYQVYLDPGVANVVTLEDAYQWEGGRGRRCEWWAKMAEKVPY